MRYAIVVVLLAGCAVGAGTSTVGIWRPKRVVDTEVCIQEGSNRCTRTTQVARDVPARSFGGGVFAWFNPGYMQLREDGVTKSRFALDSHYEYLRGRGGVALGARVGGNVGIGDKTFVFAMPITVVGHWGQERYSFYGGVGYTPYAFIKTTMADDSTITQDLHGLNAMIGTRMLLKPGRSIQMTGAVEVFQYLFFNDVSATSATASIGLHF